MNNQYSRRATIKDVARLAGVSPATVSNLLNGRPKMMSAETEASVRAAIKKLHYRPNSLARSLVRQRTSTIGVIVIELDTPLFLQGLPQIEQMGRDAGYNTLFCSAKDLKDERDALDLLVEKQVEGVIFLSTSENLDDSHIAALHNVGLPMVLINRTAREDLFDKVYWDNRGGVAEAVEHLFRYGHRRIAFMRGPENRRSATERLEGYRLGLERCGIAFREEYVGIGDYSGAYERCAESVRKLLRLEPRPSAIIASDDTVAAIVFQSVKQAGIRIPDEVSVIGIDDQPFCKYLDPPLTTVQIPMIQACRQGTQLLLDRIAGKHHQPIQRVLKCPLIVRRSTGAGAEGSGPAFKSTDGGRGA